MTDYPLFFSTPPISLVRFVPKMPSVLFFYWCAIFPRDTVTMMHEYFVGYKYIRVTQFNLSDEWPKTYKKPFFDQLLCT